MHCQKFETADKLRKLFEIRAQQETRREKDTDLIKQQIQAAFQNTTAEMKKTDREMKSAVQSDNNRYVINA